MIKFVLEDAIIKNTKKELIEYLEEIVNKVKEGSEFGMLEHEGNQGVNWFIEEE